MVAIELESLEGDFQMDDKLKVGDLVVLNSGSPELTITNIDDKDGAICSWWDGSYIMSSDRIPLVCLKLVKK